MEKLVFRALPGLQAALPSSWSRVTPLPPNFEPLLKCHLSHEAHPNPLLSTIAFSSLFFPQHLLPHSHVHYLSPPASMEALLGQF